jgi:PAS domain S-box-containing protein
MLFFEQSQRFFKLIKMAINESILKLSGLSLLSIKENATIISADNGAISVFDLEGIYTSIEELEGKKLNNILGLKSKQLTDFNSAMENVSSKKLSVIDLDLKTLRGNEKKIRLSFLKISSDGETCIKVLAKDLTEDSANLKNLLSVNQLYKTILSVAPVGIMLIDKDGAIKEFNNYLVNMFGAKSDTDFIGKIIYSFSELQEINFLSEIRSVLKDKKPAAGEKKYVSDYGKTVHFNYILVPIFFEEQEVSVFGIIEDRTKIIEMANK